MSVSYLPHFSSVDAKTYVERLDAMLQRHLQQIADCLSGSQTFGWDNLMRPLEDMDDELEQFWSPLAHLHAVVNSRELRACYQACLPKLAAYDAAIGHNQRLYDAIHSLDTTKLDNAQQKIVQDALRDFELSGVALPPEKKHRYEMIQTQLADLSNQFDNNVLDAGQAFTLHITNEDQIRGLPEHARHAAAELAKEKNREGWILNLEFPCYLAVVTYAEDRRLREQFYSAYVTRASDQGPNAGEFDNSTIIDDILALRHEKAHLLGYASYADLSLVAKMAESAPQVIEFLEDLASRSHDQAIREFQALQDFASDELGLQELAPWDIAYASEKMRKARFDLSQEELRPYFPEDTVMQGLFTIVHRLYGVRLVEEKGVDVWHTDVKCYKVLDEMEQPRGYVYVDLYARQQKRGGAWMDSLRGRRRLADGHTQLPIATLTCNFAKPSGKKIATLSHDEVLTLFHEFGHCLHHLLTRVDYLGASGINGVEWDAVELPSQFFENWCWEKSALQLLTRHVDTNESLPDELYNKLLAGKNFQSAMAMMRQLEFALFDFRIHKEFSAQQQDFVASVLADVRRKTSVIPMVPYNRFQHSFSHIFAGGYAAGYYSYKWAEVLSSDAFSRFEEEGIFNENTGRSFLSNILEAGGSKNAREAFHAFRGRDARIDALLVHNGIEP
ncbi:M3 family metallopeptidase [Legionella spiritensis]|uniref:M3 family metallopeptidase n=1 Tax=Legionella spiritensis TaxID=452 RepID=UPI000F6CC792|nr:M3 family metallopeptidase [Legionella spiritensis]VEG91751.1 Oligopeptidase A [Legionella spiritensis]